jgi:hypothetical protein
VAIVAGLAHDGDDLINGRRVRGVMLAFVCVGRSRCGTLPWSPASGVGRQRRATVEQKTWFAPLRAGRLRAQLYSPRSTAACGSSSDAGALLLDQTNSVGRLPQRRSHPD